MPLDFVNREDRRVDFVAWLEAATLTFVRDSGQARASGSARGGADSPSSVDARASASTKFEEEELRSLLGLRNQEVLRAELQDARHRASKHRERARWLEGELKLAEHKASMWRGATPASAADRIQAMERELAFLELANRLRDRLGEQRLALQQLDRRQRALTDRLSTLRTGTRRSDA